MNVISGYINRFTCGLLLVVLQAFPLGRLCLAQENANPIPRIAEKTGHYALLVDGEPFLMLGVQANNSSAWPAYLSKVRPAAETLHANTVELPVYWEQVEATEGKFDFSLVDLILKQAREHKLRLVLLWFGTWKNDSSHYTPGWMKADQVKYGKPSFGDWMQPKGNSPADGGVLVVELFADEFLVLGHHARVDFAPAASGNKWMFVALEEIHPTPEGGWETDRIWNGDQTDWGLNLKAE